MLKQLSIRQLLLLAFLLAGLLPAMLVSSLSFYQAREALKKEITHDMQTLSETVANDIERVMFERVQNVHSWSQLAVMQDIKIGDVDKRASTFLQELKSSYGDVYLAIYAVDPSGVVVASSDAHAIGKQVSTAQVWFQVRLANKLLSFAPIQKNGLKIFQEIKDVNSDQTIGLLVAEFNWQVIQDLLNKAVKNPTAAVLLDSNDNVLATTPNWDKVEAGYEMRVSAHLSNRLNLQSWQVRIEKLHSVAVAPVHRLGYVFLALLLSTLLLAALLVTPIAQAITQPLAKLSAFVRSFKQNQLAATPKLGPPEVQELGRAFESLMQDLSKSQANLTRAAKLAVVGEMAAAMSHEVRTPLGILRSSADLLLREPKLSQEGREVLGFVISETERLNKLVSSLIDAARPRALVLANFNLIEMISNAIALLTSQAKAKNVQLIFNQADAIEIVADKDQMTQVMMNLLMNAIQILPENGKVEVNVQNEKDFIQIEVLDDGAGISADNQAQIFEPFFTQRAGGVGLGLAVVRQIVQAHGGEITYQTSRYNGAQFTVTLPKAN
jgi:two-component system, NtrC family, sensor histidine kinase HydH